MRQNDTNFTPDIDNNNAESAQRKKGGAQEFFINYVERHCSKRLAIITTQAFSIGNFRGPLIREMVKCGVTVYALAPDYDNVSRSAVVALGAIPIDSSMSRTGMNPIRDMLDVFRLAIKLRSLKLDVTFGYFIKPVIYGSIASYLAGVPKRFSMIEGAGYVFIDSDKNSFRRTMLRSVVTTLYRLGLSLTQRVFMLNQDDKKLFVDSRMVAAAKVHLINGIGLELQHYQCKPPVVNPISFILIARLLREKGVYDYISAARIVKNQHPEVRFVLLGSVDLNPSSVAVAEVDAWVSEGVIEWPGHVSDVRPWIEQASVFVLPSYYREGLPRSTQEAMAMGRPVITTDMPGCRETVVDGINGLIVSARNPNELAQAMLRFIAEPSLIPKMGAESRRIAEQKYDVNKINLEILSAMEIS